MKLSTKVRYGVRLMLDLALHASEGPVALKDIAEREEISEKYLSNLVPLLRNTGLIHSVRGPGGGYSLARQPREITLKEIVLALEGPICLVDCMEKPKLCQRSEQCVMRDIWSEITWVMREAMESVTLETIVKRKVFKPTALSYDI